MQSRSKPYLSEEPPFSYIAMIAMAIDSSPYIPHEDTEWDLWVHFDALPVFSEESAEVVELYSPQPFSEWLLHKSSSQLLWDSFGKPGKGNEWTLHPGSGDIFGSGSFLRTAAKRLKCRPSQKPNEPAFVCKVNSSHHFNLFVDGVNQHIRSFVQM